VFDLYGQTSINDHLAAFLRTFTNEPTTLAESRKLLMATLMSEVHDIRFTYLADPRRVINKKKYSPKFGQSSEDMAARMSNRSFFIADNGYTRLGPSRMRRGDVLVVLFGGKVPYLLRKEPEEGH